MTPSLLFLWVSWRIPLGSDQAAGIQCLYSVYCSSEPLPALPPRQGGDESLWSSCFWDVSGRKGFLVVLLELKEMTFTQQLLVEI